MPSHYIVERVVVWKRAESLLNPGFAVHVARESVRPFSPTMNESSRKPAEIAERGTFDVFHNDILPHSWTSPASQRKTKSTDISQ